MMRLDRISSPRRVVGALKCLDFTHLFAFHHIRSLLITSRDETSLHHRKYLRHRTDFRSLILKVGYLIFVVCVVVRQRVAYASVCINSFSAMTCRQRRILTILSVAFVICTVG